MNFYHPDYKKYSLGKYLMLLKMKYAIELHMQYYYTGYLALGISKFDYKIFPHSSLIEVFIPSLNCWFPFDEIGKEGLALYANFPSQL
jgi:arginine-tRNA-protein transferase